MALQTIPGGLWVPIIPSAHVGAPSIASTGAGTLIDAVDEAWAAICRAPKTGAVRKVGVRLGQVTTGATITVGIYTVDATTGSPTTPHTLFGTTTNNTLVVAGTDDDKWVWTTLTADANV